MSQVADAPMQGKERVKYSTPHEGNLAQMKKLNAEQLLHELSSFAKELKDFNTLEPISTPQADCGIGPVKYNLTFGEGGIDERFLKTVNETIKHEKFLGDTLIKLEATLLCLKFGREDPIPHLPAAQRAAIRRKIQQQTAQFFVRHNILSNAKNPYLFSQTDEMVLECDKLNRPANSAEIAFIAERVPWTVEYFAFPGGQIEFDVPPHPGLDFEGIKSILATRRAQRRKDDLTKRLMDKLLGSGPQMVMMSGTMKLGYGTADAKERSQTHHEESREKIQPDSHQMLLRQAISLQGIPRGVVVGFIASDLLLKGLRHSQANKRALALRLQGVMPVPNIFADLSGEAQDRFHAVFTQLSDDFFADEGRLASDEELIQLARLAHMVVVHHPN